ncbi:4Fe-4S dicluster domain-containing protein [Candidatus Villigracilis affinis]|uniref:4Fe-4S dicluster domain-containing protein n=1 Tax=Candidatus Villigracilis affinis TaxID=3140682 RepID=UPI002A1FA12C|nr:cytochrome b N-terminal domain-containing protein [Anaerolineales bacterium]
MTSSPTKKQLIDSLSERNPSVDWKTRLNSPSRRLLNFFENISLRLEAPVNWLINDPRFNPLYHTGTITIFLLVVILLTGIYLTMFYPFGFTFSYLAVSKIEANFIGRIIRAMHRYASDAAVIFALLHGWRTFFQDRFRGPRWLAWVTGVGMAVVVWAIGITGYWLIWDERAQILNQSLFSILGNSKGGQTFIVDFITGEAAGTGWIFMMIVIVLHLGLSALTAFFLWLHLKRMSRAKWLPPKYWMAISVFVLLLSAALFPLGMLPPLTATQLPEQAPIDLFYLFYLPTFLRGPQALFWSALLFIIGLVTALPWIMPRAKKLEPVKVDLANCDGCTLCERDCPYLAIKMIPRTDGARPKFQADIDPNLCVSCGVCIGSCPDNALAFGDIPLNPLWKTTLERIAQGGVPAAEDGGKSKVKVVFTCERHALHGAGKHFGDPNTYVVPLTCIAMANPNLAAQALEAGASDVQFIGCPPEDCANREGNTWLNDRMMGERLPKLKPNFIPLVHTAWVAPTDFGKAVKTQVKSDPNTFTFTPNKAHLRFIIPLLGVMAVVTAFQIWLSDWPTQFFSADSATLAIQMTHHSGYAIHDIATQADLETDLDHPTRITLEVDGELVLDETYEHQDDGINQGVRIFQQVQLPVGKHRITIKMYDRPDADIEQVLFDKTIPLAPRQALTINFRDMHLPDPIVGEQIYYETAAGVNAGCRICHSLEEGETIIGPSFYGIADRAGERISGMTAEEYLRQSIIKPNAYIVPGFPEGQMIQNFGQILTAEEIDDLIAFLMTLDED